MLLFTPGPTNIPESIRQAMTTQIIHHRTNEFERIFSYCKDNLKILFNMQEIIILASSGSGAMVSCVRAFCKNVLCINSGKFGERFCEIARANNIKYVEIKNNWDTSPSIKDIANIINNEIDSICIQICESSSGLRHDVESIAKYIKNFNKNIIVIVDGIAAIGVEKIDTKHIDVLISTSQKAFMLPPGMSMIGLSKLAIKMLEKTDSTNMGFYFDLKKELKNQINNKPSWTPPISIIMGLAKYFELINIDEIYKNTKAISIATKEALKVIGLKIFPTVSSHSMSVIYNKNAKQIREILESKYKILVASGQDNFENTLLRINHMGLINIHEALWVVNATELTLNNLNIRVFDGIANKVFLDNYYRYR